MGGRNLTSILSCTTCHIQRERVKQQIWLVVVRKIRTLEEHFRSEVSLSNAICVSVSVS